MPREESRWTRPQSGQVLILFALLIVVFVGFLALVIDLGFLFGQRRYDQNGADAAAFAAGESIARNIAAYSDTGGVYIAVSDATLYTTARQYAGLSPTSLTSSVPTDTNQNPGLHADNQLAVSLEYNPGDGSGWCYSPSGPPPPRNPVVLSCAPKLIVDPNNNTIFYPPLPGTSQYKVRVTVSSTTRTFFAQAMSGWSGGAAPTSPQTDPTAPACIIVSATGDTTCAQTVIAVGGSSVYGGPGHAIPITTCDSQLNVGLVGEMYQLWGYSGKICGIGAGSWKQTLDFSDASTWCADYSYTDLLPAPCPSNDLTWNRGGFAADTTWVGDGAQKDDVPMWASVGFQGTLALGIKVPNYTSDNGQTGNLGTNLAVGFYCDSTVTATTCPGNTVTNTYFFSQTWSDFHATCPDAYGPAYSLGCRDVAVITWSNPEWVQGNRWHSSGGGAPQRVTLANYRDFRIYCGWKTANSGDNVCNQQPPSSVPGVSGSGTSSVFGRYMGPYIVNCLSCTGGLNLNGDGAVLSQ